MILFMSSTSCKSTNLGLKIMIKKSVFDKFIETYFIVGWVSVELNFRSNDFYLNELP